MAHKTLVGGTAYEITGGRTLVSGTGYDISKGRTLVGGTGYDILFEIGPVPVTITGTGDASNCYTTIAGTKYSKAASGIEVLAGESIKFHAYSYTGTYSAKIVIDGVTVKSSDAVNKSIEYTWTVPEKCRSISIALKMNNPGASGYYTITVTTT